MIGVRRIYELLDAPAPPPSGFGQPATIKRGRIEFDRVGLAYADGEPVLRGLSFIAEAGRTTALVGASGAGKTSALALVLRFYNPTAGRILIDGQDIASIDVDSLRSQIAFVSQDVRLFSGTVRENIRFGRLRATDAEVEAAARDALADSFIEALPNGYDTELGEQGAQLSGGQRQRLAIARALIRDARIILLDEATSALDAESEMRVQAAFDRLKRGRTTIVVAHRLSTIASADRICVLADGAIAEQGTHDELVAAGGVYARLYRLQFGGDAAPPVPEADLPRPHARKR
jgi:ATP-binding cassette subfamily B protein